MSPLASFTKLDPPERFGRYLLFYEITRDELGTLYLARGTSPGSQAVLLKRLDPKLLRDEHVRTTLLEDARLASQIAHPNTASAIDVGEARGDLYLTMPFVLGEPLDRVIAALNRAKLDVRARVVPVAVRILMDVCEGLHAVHELRDAHGKRLEVVHRHVTPENVIVGYDGVTRVVDFALARAARRLSMASDRMEGTHAYASPEQLQGQFLDRRADIWSLGVLTYELFTGTRLFDAEDSLSTVERVLTQPMQGPCEIVTELPMGLDEITLRALHRDPDRRYASAREMARDFAWLLTDLGRPASAADVAECLAELFPRQQLVGANAVTDARTRDVPEPELQRFWTSYKLFICGALGVALGSIMTWLMVR